MSTERSGFQKLNSLTFKASLPLLAFSVTAPIAASFLSRSNDSSNFNLEEYCRYENSSAETSFTSNSKYEVSFPAPAWEKKGCALASIPKGTAVDISPEGEVSISFSID